MKFKTPFLIIVFLFFSGSLLSAQIRFVPRVDTFYNDQIQVILGLEEKPGIEKVTGFHRMLAEGGRFEFVRTAGSSKKVYGVKKLVGSKLTKTPVVFTLTGQAEFDGRKVTVTETVRGEKNGVRFTLDYDPAAAGKDRYQGVFILRLPEKVFQAEKFQMDGKEVLSAFRPRKISLGQTPCVNMAVDIQKGGQVRFRRTSGEPWVMELESTPEGQLDFTILPPAPAVAITLATDRYRNVFEEKQPVRIDVRLDGRLKIGLPVTVKTTIADYYGQVVYQDTRDKTLPSGKDDIQSIVPPITKKGFYTVTTEVLDRKYNQRYSNFLTFGVIRPHPLDRPFKPTDYFGLFGVSGAYDDGLALTLAKKIGVQWSRDECGWAYREPVKGKYDWSFTDKAVEITDKLKIGNMFFGEFAAWGMGKGWRPPLQDWEAWRTFCRLKARRYAGKGNAWEVSNEVYIGEMPVENCVQVHKVALEEAKKVDPNTVVLACVSAPWAFNYLQAFLKAGGAKACDAIAVHPYVCGGTASPEAGDLAGYQKKVRSEIDKYRPGMPVWWTEFSWAADDHDNLDLPDDAPEPMRKISLPERLAANYCVRAHLIGLAGGVRHFIYFCFKSYNEKWHYNMVRQEGIKPIVCAYNTMTWMLDGKEFAGTVKIEPKVYAMAFDGSDTSVLAYWYTGTPEKSSELVIPIKGDGLQVVDLMDNRETIRTRGGRIILPIDGGPRFILSNRNGKTLLSAFAKAAVAFRPNPRTQCPRKEPAHF